MTELNEKTQILSELAEEIVNDLNLGKVSTKIIKTAGEKGDGYVGEKYTISIITDLGKSLNLYIKCAPKGELFRQMLPVKLTYEREIFFYETILPAFKSFQSERRVLNPFKCTMKCYKTFLKELHEMVVLHNASRMDYKLWDRFKPMDAVHIAVVLKEYGKLHAISYAMKDQQPDKYKELKDKLNEVNIQGIFANAPGYDVLMESATKMYDETKDADLLQKFRKFNETFLDYYMREVKCADEFSVITHADCWNNNMMFKYNNPKRSEKPIEMIFLDFQLMREVSPILDVSSFLFACGSREIFNNINHYLNMYYQSLSNHLAALGSDPDKIFSKMNFQKQWKKYGNFGLGMGIGLLKIAVKVKEEFLDLEKQLQKGNDIMDSFKKASKSDQLYFARLKPVVDHCYKHGLI